MYIRVLIPKKNTLPSSQTYFIVNLLRKVIMFTNFIKSLFLSVLPAGCKLKVGAPVNYPLGQGDLHKIYVILKIYVIMERKIRVKKAFL
jgi:hypothetical protein